MRGIADDDFRRRLLYASMSDRRRPTYLRIALMMRNSIERDINQWMNFDPTGTADIVPDDLCTLLTDLGAMMPVLTADDMNTGMDIMPGNETYTDMQRCVMSVETERFRIAKNMESLDARLGGGSEEKSSVLGVPAKFFELPAEYPDLSSPQTTLEIVKRLCHCMEMQNANEVQRNLSSHRSWTILQGGLP
jgi:hypothetical protein